MVATHTSRLDMAFAPAVLAGGVFGLVLYFVNFYLWTAVFPGSSGSLHPPGTNGMAFRFGTRTTCLDSRGGG